MRSAFCQAACAVTLLVAASATPGASPSATLQGSLREKGGAVIPDAFVLVHEDGSGQIGRPLAEDARIRSDSQGRFRVDSRLEPGFYDVCVMAMAFVPECRKVLLKENGTVTLNFQLKIDPRVLDEFGDRFTGR
jgi:hypothetical protein